MVLASLAMMMSFNLNGIRAFNDICPVIGTTFKYHQRSASVANYRGHSQTLFSVREIYLKACMLVILCWITQPDLELNLGPCMCNHPKPTRNTLSHQDRAN